MVVLVVVAASAPAGGGEWRMSGKTVVLVNAAEPLPNLTFLI